MNTNGLLNEVLSLTREPLTPTQMLEPRSCYNVGDLVYLRMERDW